MLQNNAKMVFFKDSVLFEMMLYCVSITFQIEMIL